MKIYGIFDKILDDYVMVTLAPNDKTVIRGLRLPKDASPEDYDVVCLGNPKIDHKLGSVSDFVKVNEQGGINPENLRSVEGN